MGAVENFDLFEAPEFDQVIPMALPNGFNSEDSLDDKIVATRGAERQVDSIKRAQEAREVRDSDHANELKQKLESLADVKVAVKTSDTGKLFGSVTAGDVASAIKAAGGPTLDKRAVEMPKEHIKSTGAHSVVVDLGHDTTARVAVEVVPA